ncbi:nitroreductase family protein [Streptomyces sp. NPDC002205]|uniref:nitroreductase family protein n=1 Tax=Streptomyces sp. NPDC002205 TaxID=3154411 RepID=UPI003323BC5A
MDVMTAILTRRSEQTLLAPAPGEEEFVYLLRGAATFLDHGLPRPWRWILLRGGDRPAPAERVARQALATACPNGSALPQAPLLAALVLDPHADPAVPEEEQEAAANAMTHALMLLLHSRGYSSLWRTGHLPAGGPAAAALGLNGSERLVGALSIGTPDTGRPLARRALADVEDRVSAFPSPAPTG